MSEKHHKKSKEDLTKETLEHHKKEDAPKESKDLVGQLQRMQADFANYKRRVEEQEKEILHSVSKEIVQELLPIADAIDHALHDEKQTKEQLEEGMKMLKNQLHAVFENTGVKSFDSMHQAFDPERHEAMMTVSEEDFDDQVIVQEFSKGYTIGNKVLRHAKVVVNKKKQGDTEK